MHFNLYINDETDSILWVDDSETIGELIFTFDGIKFYNLFRDYPRNMTVEEMQVFNHENPYWKVFFRESTDDYNVYPSNAKGSKALAH